MPPSPAQGRLHVETLFTAHAALSAILGSISFLFPHIGEYFLVPHGEVFRFRDNRNSQDQVPHLIIRLLAALLLATGALSFLMRKVKDPEARRAVVRAYSFAFALSLLAMLRSQLVRNSVLLAWNWLNIAGFALLTWQFGYYAWLEPVNSFSLPVSSMHGRLV